MSQLIGQVITDQTGKQYTFLENINEGVYGAVLKVSCDYDNEILAMKVFKNSHPSILCSWDTEVKAMKMMMSVAAEKNITRMIDSGFFKGAGIPADISNKFIVMKVLGPSVYEVMNPKENRESNGRKIAFENSNILSIANQVAIAMLELHKMKIIHLDLKPENICFVKVDNMIVTERVVENVTLISMESTQIQLIDLGCAVFLTDEENPEDFVNQEAQTQNYRAPEVILGIGVSRKSDVWSYGCILSELYTGEVLFFGSGEASSEEVQLDVMTFVLQRSVPYRMFQTAFDYGSRKVTMSKNGLHFHRYNKNPMMNVASIFACVRVDDPDGIRLYELILSILQMDPEYRPTFSEIIKKEYFVGTPIEID